MTTPFSMAVLVLLAVLAGSLLGSFRAFFAGGGTAGPDALPEHSQDQIASGWRPSHSNHGAPASYTVQRDSAPRGGVRRVISVLMALTLGFAVSATAAFSYLSPWSTETDLRHLAAGIHCSIAQKVGLASAAAGQPGYFRITDPDGNGISCEPAGSQDTVLSALPTNRLSAASLGWPDGLSTSR